MRAVLLGLLLFAQTLFAQEAQDNATLRSSPPPPLPTQVETSVFLWKIQNINEKDETFSAYIYLNLTWKDGRLASTAKEAAIFTEEAVDEKFKEIWWPEWDFVNATEMTINNRTLSIAPDGTVHYALKLLGTFFTPIDFRKFPFDKQTFNIRIESFIWPTDQVHFVVDQKNSGFAEDEYLDKFTLKGVSMATPVVKYLDQNYSEFTFSIHLDRPTKFYLYQVLIPLLVILGITVTMFYVDVSDLSTRLIMAQGSILVLIALKFMINDRLPQIDYLTIIDYCFFIAYFYCTMAVGIACYQFREWKKESGAPVKTNSLVLWIPLFLCLILYFFIFLYFLH